jgi:hypothetical protein
LISRVLPFAEPSDHSSEPSAANCTEPGCRRWESTRCRRPTPTRHPSRRLDCAARHDAVAVADDAHAVAVERQQSWIGRRAAAARDERDPLAVPREHRIRRRGRGEAGDGPLRLAVERRDPDLSAAGEGDLFCAYESVKFAASARPPETRAGLAVDGDTVHSVPFIENSSSLGDIHAKRSDVRRADVRVDGKSVSATGFWPGVTTNRSCFPHASHRNATIDPSGDHAGADGYLICEMRSMVMLPRGGSAAAGIASSTQTRRPALR